VYVFPLCDLIGVFGVFCLCFISFEGNMGQYVNIARCDAAWGFVHQNMAWARTYCTTTTRLANSPFVGKTFNVFLFSWLLYKWTLHAKTNVSISESVSVRTCLRHILNPSERLSEAHGPLIIQKEPFATSWMWLENISPHSRLRAHFCRSDLMIQGYARLLELGRVCSVLP